VRPEATVEELLELVAAWKPHRIGELHELSIPDVLTLRGKPVAPDIAMAIVLDALLAKGLFPAGFVSERGGRTYRYRFEGLGEGTASSRA
jgi:hypothetical protein